MHADRDGFVGVRPSENERLPASIYSPELASWRNALLRTVLASPEHNLKNTYSEKTDTQNATSAPQASLSYLLQFLIIVNVQTPIQFLSQLCAFQPDEVAFIALVAEDVDAAVPNGLPIN